MSLSSRCASSSSRTRGGRSSPPVARRQIASISRRAVSLIPNGFCDSGIAHPRQPDDQLVDRRPLLRPLLEPLPSGGGDVVVIALAARVGVLPLGADESGFLQFVEDGIDGPLLPREEPAGLVVDASDDLV